MANGRNFKLLFVGAKGVGKTSALRKFTDNTFNPRYESTIHADCKIRTVKIAEDEIKLACQDTPGDKDDSIIVTNYLLSTDVIVGCFDSTNPKKSLADLKDILTTNTDRLWFRNGQSKPIILLGCKPDLRDRKNDDKLSEELKKFRSDLLPYNITILTTEFINAKDDDCDKLLKALTPAINDVLSKRAQDAAEAAVTSITEAAPQPSRFTRFKNFMKRNHVLRTALIASAILLGVALFVTAAVFTAGAVPLAFGTGATAITAFLTSTAIGSSILAGCGGALGLFGVCVAAMCTGLGIILGSASLHSVFTEKDKPLAASSNTPNNATTSKPQNSTAISLNSMNSISSAPQRLVTKAKTSEGEHLAVLPVVENADKTAGIPLSQSPDTLFSSSHSSEEDDFESKFKPGSNTAYSLSKLHF